MANRNSTVKTAKNDKFRRIVFIVPASSSREPDKKNLNLKIKVSY